MQQENKKIAKNTSLEIFCQNISTKFRKNQKYTTPGLPQISYFCGKSEKYINQLNPGVKNKSAFTLVELIIVITILAILATIAYISFQGYTKDARDGTRMSDIRQIYNGLSIYKTQTEKTLLPDNYINIQSGTTTISYQGYAGASVLRTLKISGGKDPGTKDYYIYTTDVNTKKAQLMTYMETADKDIQYLSHLKSLKLIQQAEATNSGYYQDKKIYVYGDKIGIVTNNKVPLQETTISTGIDIITLTGNITTYFGGNVYSGGLSTSTGLTLVNQINGAVNNALPCSPITYNGYNITSLQDKQNQTFTKTGVITGGTQTGSIVVTCNNGTLSYSSENTQTSCGANFTLNGNTCNAVPVLLLHGDNITSPTSFVDSSVSNKTVTRNGNATQVIGGGYFNGSSYLSIPDNEDWNFGSGDFTIDMWVNFSVVNSNYQVLASQWGVGGNNGSWYLAWGSNTLSFSTSTDGSTTTNNFNTTSNFTPNVGQWYHIALVKSGTGAKIYINGVEKGSTTTQVGTLYNSTRNINIGSFGDGSQLFNGYIDEVRISKGIARWTNNFTPPTSEYTTDSYTKLLLHFNGNGSSFTDDSGTSKSITANGSVTQYPSKFGSGTMYFDGNGDYLSLANSTDWQFGSGDFTIDWWMNIPNSGNICGSENGPYANGSNACGIIGYWGVSDSLSSYGWWIGGRSSMGFTTRDASNNGSSLGFSLPPANTWTHYAVVRNGTNLYGFTNGTLVSTGTLSPGFIVNVPTNSPSLTIGMDNRYSGYNWKYSGYLDEVRVVKGAAVWTSNFTPPTAPY